MTTYRSSAAGDNTVFVNLGAGSYWPAVSSTHPAIPTNPDELRFSGPGWSSEWDTEGSPVETAKDLRAAASPQTATPITVWLGSRASTVILNAGSEVYLEIDQNDGLPASADAVRVQVRSQLAPLPGSEWELTWRRQLIPKRDLFVRVYVYDDGIHVIETSESVDLLIRTPANRTQPGSLLYRVDGVLDLAPDGGFVPAHLLRDAFEPDGSGGIRWAPGVTPPGVLGIFG